MTMSVGRLAILVTAALTLVESVAQTEVRLRGAERKDHRRIVLDSGYNLQVFLSN